VNRAILGLLLLLPVTEGYTDTLTTIHTVANRVPQSDTLASVSILSEEDIRHSPANSLTELLSTQTGISFSRSGGVGQPSSLYLRGTESDHTLILIDGIRLSSVSDGATALRFLPLSQISRIEIVRGPRSGLYGSEALGGVIEITTQKASANRLSGQVKAGSFDSYQTDFGFSSRQKSTQSSIQLSAETTDGINATENGNPDRDSFDSASVTAQLAHKLNERMNLDFHLFNASGDSEFDDPFSETSQDSSDFLQQAVNLKYQYQPVESLNLSASLGQSRDELDIDGTIPGFFDSRIDQLTLQSIYQRNGQKFSIGADYRDENLNSSTDYDRNQRDNSGVFFSGAGHFQRHHLELGLRHDDHESYGNHITGNFSYGYDLTETIKLIASYAEGFKSPSFNDLYFPASDFYQPNPNLSPETSKSYEFGLRAGYPSLNLEANVYQTEIDDMITFAADPVTFIGTVENIDQARIEGIELNLRTSFWNSTVEAGFSHINAQDRNTDKRLIRRPEDSVSLTINHEYQKLSFLLQYLYYGDREDLDFSSFPASRITLDQYSLLNANIKYSLSKKWEWFLQLNNIFDEDYQTVAGYHQPGAAGYIGVRYNPR